MNGQTRAAAATTYTSPAKNTNAADYDWDLEVFVTMRSVASRVGVTETGHVPTCSVSAVPFGGQLPSERGTACSYEWLSLHYAAAPLGKDKKNTFASFGSKLQTIFD